MVSYILRPSRYVPTPRSSSLTNEWTCASGTAQSKFPCSSATYPSIEQIAE